MLGGKGGQPKTDEVDFYLIRNCCYVVRKLTWGGGGSAKNWRNLTRGGGRKKANFNWRHLWTIPYTIPYWCPRPKSNKVTANCCTIEEGLLYLNLLDSNMILKLVLQIGVQMEIFFAFEVCLQPFQKWKGCRHTDMHTAIHNKFQAWSASNPSRYFEMNPFSNPKKHT